MKKQLQIAALLCVASGGMLVATTNEFRSPLRLIRGVMHAPFQPVQEAWWTDQTPECDDPPCWQIDSWGAGYYRAANQAFFNGCGGSTTHTTSLSTLFFGAESFTGEQFFVNGTMSASQLNSSTPFLGFSRISPRFKYTERGIVAGINAMRTFGDDDCWHAGFRAGLPVKEIEVEPVDLGTLEESLGNVYDIRLLCTGTGPADTQYDYAFRLDFLTALSQCVIDSSNNLIVGSFVSYDDGTGSPDVSGSGTYLGTVLSSGVTPGGIDDSVDEPPVYLTRIASGGSGAGNCLFTTAPSGIFPSVPYCKPATAVTGGGLNADGSGGSIGQSMFFEFGEDYAAGLGTDTNAQAALFVVPRCDPDINGNPAVSDQGNAIRAQVQQLLASLSDTFETSVEFFQSKGIDFTQYDRNVGVGDFDVEAYVGYGHPEDWYLDGILGVRFPTGTRPPNATNIYFQPTGNKKHYEIKLALEGGVEPVEWFGFHAYVAYNHAFKAGECRAAPFKQLTSPCNTPCCETANCCTPDNCDDCCTPNTNQFACIDCSSLFVKNVGPNLCVDVAWDYFVGYFDFTFFHPCNRELGATFGYEVMYKGKDHVSGDNCDCSTAGTLTATDLLGNTNQPLDLSILEFNTKTITHKLYAELFNRWNFCELFIGASTIVAGVNSMKESEAHLGMKFFF
jgi:hypothetical protein